MPLSTRQSVIGSLSPLSKDRAVFERGPPESVRLEMQRLHAQAGRTAQRTAELRAEIDWPEYVALITEDEAYDSVNDEDRED